MCSSRARGGRGRVPEDVSSPVQGVSRAFLRATTNWLYAMENALYENVRETENEFWERELEITMTSDHVLQSGFELRLFSTVSKVA